MTDQFSQIISDLRKKIDKLDKITDLNCEQHSSLLNYVYSLLTKNEQKVFSDSLEAIDNLHVCQAKLDQTLLCEKIANELLSQQNKTIQDEANLEHSNREKNTGFADALIQEKQKHKDFMVRVLNRIIGKIEDSRNNGEMIVDYCKKIKAELESEDKQ
jgi:hypothetical protein